MKKCPFCAEQIQDEAIKCRYCGEYTSQKPMVIGIAPGDIIDGLTVGREVGRGGMAIVYLASDPSLARDVALKVLPANLIHDEELCRRFQKEARLAAGINHPNIIPIYSVGQSSAGQPYFTMAYLQEGTLTDKLKLGTMPVDEAIRIVCGILAGLNYAHDKGIIHRDIKPDNILFSDVDLPVIADFGIAAAAQGSKTVTNLSISIGTPLYMSPEQFKGEKVDCRSDIYSVGALFYQILTGTPPFKRADLPGLMYEHMTVAPKPPAEIRAEIPAEIERAILKALAKGPQDRFQNAAQFLLALGHSAGSISSAMRNSQQPGGNPAPQDDVFATQPIAIEPGKDTDNHHQTSAEPKRKRAVPYVVKEDLSEDDFATASLSDLPTEPPETPAAQQPAEKKSTDNLPNLPADAQAAALSNLNWPDKIESYPACAPKTGWFLTIITFIAYLIILLDSFASHLF